MANSKLYLRDDETFEEGRFAWFVSLKPAFAAPLRHLVIHNTNPKRLDLVIDISGQGLTPRMMYRPNFMPLGGIDGNLHEVIERSALNETEQTFRLCVYDSPAPLETWRQLEFKAIYGPVLFQHEIVVTPEVREYVKKSQPVFGRERATFTLTVSGRVEKIGDWMRVDEPGIELDQDVVAFRKRKLQEIAVADKAEREAQSMRNAVDAGKGFASGLFELIGNIHREAKNNAAEKKALEARQGSFHTQKDLMQIFGEVYQILQKPLGAFRFSVKADPETCTITAVCRWLEDLPWYANGERELSSTFTFEGSENGTRIDFVHALYEVPPGSLHSDHLVRILNGWVKALAI